MLQGQRYLKNFCNGEALGNDVAEQAQLKTISKMSIFYVHFWLSRIILSSLFVFSLIAQRLSFDTTCPPPPIFKLRSRPWYGYHVDTIVSTGAHNLTNRARRESPLIRFTAEVLVADVAL